MNLFGWVRSMIQHRDPPAEAIEARALARRIAARADALSEQLSVYKRSRDPFAAMMADLYNRDQVNSIWRGPDGD